MPFAHYAVEERGFTDVGSSDDCNDWFHVVKRPEGSVLCLAPYCMGIIVYDVRLHEHVRSSAGIMSNIFRFFGLQL
jgi:hypothetical protein